MYLWNINKSFCIIFSKLKMYFPTLMVFMFLLIKIETYSQNPCPVDNGKGTVVTGQIIVSERGGFVPLVQGQDTQCYEYILDYSFYRIPDVAISVYEFQSQPSEHLHYFIKPIRSESLSSISFVIHTSWPYTKWIRISFSFLAEDRIDFQAGYYQVDTGILSNCKSEKTTHTLLPFRTHFPSSSRIFHHLFLHGFEINIQRIAQNSRSPYEIQLLDSQANMTGIQLTLSVTTITQVNFLYISYLAYQDTSLQIIGGKYSYSQSRILSHIPNQIVGRNYARMNGITGFVINYHHQSIQFQAQWTGGEFIFQLGQSTQFIQYLSYEYIFFVGSKCKDCAGYTISYNNTCVRFCPADTFVTPEGICLSCGEGRYWNGTSCQISCPQGQYLNQTTKQCQCPNSMNWNGEVCIACTQGKTFNETTKTCECPYPLRWNGFVCKRVSECTGGKQWNVYTYSCQCPSYLTEINGVCVEVPVCKNGMILNSQNKCVCPAKTYWNGKSCVFTNCRGTQYWDGTKCTCRTGFHFNDRTCIECINGQVWNTYQKICECEDGYEWTGNYCKKQFKCSNGRVWNATYQRCICPENYYWAGIMCKLKPTCCCGQVYNKNTNQCQCLSGSKWNGSECVKCQNGKVWDEPTRKCLCPPGTKWNNNFCSVIVKCGGGMIWNQNTWSCECPSNTVWNGHFCISNPCTAGRMWNETYKSCQCPDNKIWQNDACIPPKIACTYGKIWDPTIYACCCPDGTFQQINSCDPIPYCRGQKIYNPYNNKCQCPYGLKPSGNKCVAPSCPQNLFWNGYKCVVINCPPLTMYKNGKCQKYEKPKDKCKLWQLWNGKNCIYFPQSCPMSTSWNGTHCAPIQNSCPEGYYKDSTHHCQPFPQLCLPPTYWDGLKCGMKNNQCPDKTFHDGRTCMPYVPCKNGMVWSSQYLYCVCPQHTQSNGHNCLSCPNGKIWVPQEGCQCPKGHYDIGLRCQIFDQFKCKNIPNSQWKDNACVCKEGFIAQGLQCVCRGLDMGTYCDRCAHKPHSQWSDGMCKCYDGYSEVYGTCVPDGTNTGNDDPSRCSPGTYFDTTQRRCLPCPIGCLSCSDCYTCNQCRPEFRFYAPAKKCIEYCGDGFKFVTQCDDGNNEDGDGCSFDCKIQKDYVCTGGSPNSADNCRMYKASEVQLVLTGQIRLRTSMVLNIKVNHVPKELLQSYDCNNECESILIGEIIDGDKSSTSMESKYIAGTSFSFSFKVDFGREYIGKFTIKIRISPEIAAKYYGGPSSTQQITTEVNPAYLSTVKEDQLS